MVEIECLACRKAIKPQQLNDSNNYDTENYDGHVVCQECESLLYVKLIKAKVQKYRIVDKQSGPITLKFVPPQSKKRQTPEEGDKEKSKANNS